MADRPRLTDYRALSFDCYGTLIDWETGILAALSPALVTAGYEGPDGAVLAAFAAAESNEEKENPTAPYPEILTAVASRVGLALGVELNDEAAASLGRSVGDWPAFDDSATALTELAERFSLIVLSNVDRESFAASNARLGVAFDLVITAADVGTYKPDPRNFEHLLVGSAALGVDEGRLLHVAQSRYHDIEPATALGLPTAWIDRREGRPGGATTPTSGRAESNWRFTSMRELADAVRRERRPASGEPPSG